MPFLEIGRLARLLRTKCGFGEANNGNQAGRQRHPRLPPSGSQGSGCDGGRGVRTSPAPSINGVGEESGDDRGDEPEHHNSDSDTLGVEEREPYGAESLSSRGGRGSGKGRAREYPRADGLEGLTRQVAV